jgi:hypothetical protein
MEFYDQSSEYLLRESGISIRVYDHLKWFIWLENNNES